MKLGTQVYIIMNHIQKVRSHADQVLLKLKEPLISLYAVSVTVGGWGSAIIDWQKYIYTSKCS